MHLNIEPYFTSKSLVHLISLKGKILFLRFENKINKYYIYLNFALFFKPIVDSTNYSLRSNIIRDVIFGL